MIFVGWIISDPHKGITSRRQETRKARGKTQGEHASSRKLPYEHVLCRLRLINVLGEIFMKDPNFWTSIASRRVILYPLGVFVSHSMV